MFERIQIIAIFFGIALLALVLNLIRNRQMHEDYSLLWLMLSVVILILAVFKNLLFACAHILGAIYPASAIFFIGMVFVSIMNLHFSAKISKLDKANKELAQELALTRQRMEKTLKQTGEDQ